MDISNIKPSLAAAKAQETAIAAILRQFSSTRTAQLLEVVPLSKAQIESLLLKQVLPQTLNKQLESYLKQLNSATLGENRPKLEVLSLVKIKPDQGGLRAFWSLTNIDLKVGNSVTLARSGAVLAMLPDPLAKQAPSTQSLPASTDAIKPANAMGTAESPILAAREVSMAPKVVVGASNPLLYLEPKAINTLLNQIIKLSLPVQDQRLSFVTGFRPLANGANSEMLKLAALSRQPELKELGLLLSRMQTWFASLPKFDGTAPEKIKQALQVLGPFANSVSSKSETLIAHSSVGKDAVPVSEKSEDIKAIIDQLLPLLKRLETIAPSLSRSNSQLLDALVRIFVSLYPSSARNVRSETGDKAASAMKQLEQLAVGTLARLVSSQATSVSQSLFSDSGAGFQIESQLLLRHNEQILPVTIFIREERRKDVKHRNKNSAANNIWEVFLEWEIDGFGAYHTSLKVRDNTVSAKIWAEKSDIRQRIKEKISNLHEVLERNGVDVETLQCTDLPLNNMHNRPAHTLIDVRT